MKEQDWMALQNAVPELRSAGLESAANSLNYVVLSALADDKAGLIVDEATALANQEEALRSAWDECAKGVSGFPSSDGTEYQAVSLALRQHFAGLPG